MNENVDALLARLTHVQLEALAEACEEYLDHRFIPLHSHSYTNIIRQAFKEGFMFSKYLKDGRNIPPGL